MMKHQYGVAKPLVSLWFGMHIGLCLGGPYAPAAGETGSTAIHKDSPAFMAWASGWTNYQVGADCHTMWQTPENAMGPAVGSSFDIVCLGRDGRITMTFNVPIANGAGYDFAVFENAINNTFLELAFVEVSSDGIHFFRFANDSLTPGGIGPFGTVDPTNISGLASKYRQAYGTPFDLEELKGVSSLLDLQQVKLVRLLDIPGDGRFMDSGGQPIYDPYPILDSAGFDLDAIGVINIPFTLNITPLPQGMALSWNSFTNFSYSAQYTTSLCQPNWLPLPGFILGGGGVQTIVDSDQSVSGRFYRVTASPVP